MSFSSDAWARNAALYEKTRDMPFNQELASGQLDENAFKHYMIQDAHYLAARAALDSHRGTIDVLHLMGATDVQIARLFQRRIALDALFGGIAGFGAALLVIAALGSRLEATGSDLIRAIALPWSAWALLILLPVAGVLLAILAARLTILRALGRAL